MAGSRKAVVIDDAQNLTEEAQNALLKVLEEPSPSTVLILVTAHPQRLLATITSRVQEVRFAFHPRKTFMKMFADEKLSEEQKAFLYSFSLGAIGLVKTLLERDGLKEIKTSAEDFAKLRKMDLSKRFEIAKTFADEEPATVEHRVLLWLLYLHTKVTDVAVSGVVLGPLCRLYADLHQPQLNRQLALENFMLEL